MLSQRPEYGQITDSSSTGRLPGVLVTIALQLVVQFRVLLYGNLEASNIGSGFLNTAAQFVFWYFRGKVYEVQIFYEGQRVDSFADCWHFVFCSPGEGTGCSAECFGGPGGAVDESAAGSDLRAAASLCDR